MNSRRIFIIKSRIPGRTTPFLNTAHGPVVVTETYNLHLARSIGGTSAESETSVELIMP